MQPILKYLEIPICADALRRETNGSAWRAAVGELAWLERFPALKVAARVKSGSTVLENAILLNGELFIRSASGLPDAVAVELPYYICDSLYKDHVVLPLDEYRDGVLPEWLHEELPWHFYSSLVLLGESSMVDFARDFEGYEDFCGHIAQVSVLAKKMRAPRWGMKVLRSKLPRPVAASREICFDLAHGDMSLPLQVSISPTNACNLRCTICGSQAHLDACKIPREFMRRDVFEKIAETVFPFCRAVELNSLGEPTLHKDFSYFVELINKYDCELVLQTNGTLLTDAVLRALEKSRGRISLSIDAVGEVFEQQRVNASWEKVDANVRKLMRVRDRNRLEVFLYPTLTQRTLQSAVPLCEWAEACGIDHVVFHYYDPIQNGIERHPTEEQKSELEENLRTYIRKRNPLLVISLQYCGLSSRSFLRSARKAAARLRAKVAGMCGRDALSRFTGSFPRKAHKFSSPRWYNPNLPKVEFQKGAHPRYVCVAPVTNAVINVAGDISVCCRTQTTVFGSCLTDEDFRASWFGERMQAVRRSFSRDDPVAVSIPECRGCIAASRHFS